MIEGISSSLAAIEGQAKGALSSTDDALKTTGRVLGRRTPGYRVTLDGKDITPSLNGRLIDISLTRQRRDYADQVDITLSDADGRLALPRRGVALWIALGWVDAGLVPRGQFIVDEVEYSGAPDQVTIRARSANMREDLPTRRTQSWHKALLGDVVKSIAARNKLAVRVDSVLASIRVAHLDQVDESDMNVLSRLGDNYGGVPVIAAGTLMFMRPGASTTASGKAIPAISIKRSDGDRYRYSAIDRESFTGVKARWNHVSHGKTKEVIIGTTERLRTMQKTYASESDARLAARAELDRAKREAAQFSIELALARPEMLIESPVILSGFKSEIDALRWVAVEIVERLSGNGYTAEIKCETR